MIFDVREEKYPYTKYVVYVWSGEIESDDFFEAAQTTYPESVYDELNQWCKESFGSHTRTAYNIFEFKKYKYLQWFLLRWSESEKNVDDQP